ncbi:hypothetical protein H7J88_20515 [Mycolicibacterium flavescens]|uniref:Secreted protein n=1 Tax=Mycolicibacterium flavescens TaxID=1776 RepID=A0A1E3R7Z6_MYCFV|nr:hypothetical protein [Mycolicibacterium flavescens]MCV7282017.1 hypothetical protein [Mycolicibacterium flavescens]ODQ86040.1 hypothetical protein BHQ18_27615 [Mycolicibacterium flavescens]
MNKSMIAATCVAAALALAPGAGAQTPPPIAPGNYIYTHGDGASIPVTVAYDCGPDCYSVSGADDRYEFRWQPQGIWVAAPGIWTADGFDWTHPRGTPGRLTPA